jgi:branched-chain amino acid aminotransferase
MQGCASLTVLRHKAISIATFLHSTTYVARINGGKFFACPSLARFFASCDALRLNPGVTRDEARRVMHECVRRAGLRDAYVELLCTRGLPAAGSRDPRTCSNRFIAFAIPFIWIADLDKQRRGVNLIVGSPHRIPPGSVDPRIKNYHWLDFVMGLFQAYERGGETVVLLDAQGHVTEGPGFNVFGVFDRGGRKQIVTAESGVLEGVSRRTVIELARSAGFDVQVRPWTAAELRAADEVF